MRKKVVPKLQQKVKVVSSLVMISKFITLGNSRISLLGIYNKIDSCTWASNSGHICYKANRALKITWVFFFKKAV